MREHYVYTCNLESLTAKLKTCPKMSARVSLTYRAQLQLL